jgi:perosamine synthetase
MRISEEILDRIRSVVGRGRIGLHEPYFIGEEARYLLRCLETTYVSSIGEYVNEFEKRIIKFTGTRFCVATINGTAALHLALVVSDISKQSEVFVSPLTFVATANAICYVGATPHFVDIEEENFGIDAKALDKYIRDHMVSVSGKLMNPKTGRFVEAIMPMHFLGHPSKMDDIRDLACEYKLKIIEDAAESFGSLFEGQHTGTFGDLGIFSFNGNKIITTGSGGALVTNDPRLAERARHLATTAKLQHPWEYRHDQIGFNYRLSNLNAALGCAQIESIHDRLKAKKKLFSRYQKAFEGCSEINLIAQPDKCSSNYWLQSLRLSDNVCSLKDKILRELNNDGIISRPLWTPLHQLKPFEQFPQMEARVVSRVHATVINIPSNVVCES